MVGVRFYEEYTDRRKRESAGNVVAVYVGREYILHDGTREATGAVYYHANSPVASCSVSWDYLLTRCKRVSEARAREVHPNLFTFLEL